MASSPFAVLASRIVETLIEANQSRNVDWNFTTRLAEPIPLSAQTSRGGTSRCLQESAEYSVCREIPYSADSSVFFSPAATRLRISAICIGVSEGLRPL
jgi:hypothetical protein